VRPSGHHMRSSEQQMMGAKRVDTLEGETAAPVRRHIRYPLRASASFKWLGLDGVERSGKGSSRDISEGGAYIVTRNCPPHRGSVELAIRFSSLRGLPRSYRLEMRGRVVRIEPLLHSKESWGFALEATQPVLQEVDGFDHGPEGVN